MIVYETKPFQTSKSPAWEKSNVTEYKIQFRKSRFGIFQRHIWIYKDGTELVEGWIPSRESFMENILKEVEVDDE